MSMKLLQLLRDEYVSSSQGAYLEILILFLCQGLFGDHENPQPLPRHVSALHNRDSNIWLHQVAKNNSSVLDCLFAAGIKRLLLHQRCVKMKDAYLLLQPVVVLHDASHHHVSTLHVEGDLSRRLVLGNKHLPVHSVRGTNRT